MAYAYCPHKDFQDIRTGTINSCHFERYIRKWCKGRAKHMALRHLVVWRIVVNTTLSCCYCTLYSQLEKVFVHHHMRENSEYLLICYTTRKDIYVCGWVMCAFSWMCWHYSKAEYYLLMQKFKPTINGFNIAYKIPCGSDSQWWHLPTSPATEYCDDHLIPIVWGFKISHFKLVCVQWLLKCSFCYHVDAKFT